MVEINNQDTLFFWGGGQKLRQLPSLMRRRCFRRNGTSGRAAATPDGTAGEPVAHPPRDGKVTLAIEGKTLWYELKRL